MKTIILIISISFFVFVQKNYSELVTLNQFSEVELVIKARTDDSLKTEKVMNAATKDDKSIEPFPILSYDTDAGLGYGAKGFFLNLLGLNESFDLTFFNSTKGERWYRFVFSMPDFELRQGKNYPAAFDLIVDYDKYIKNNFFGTGSGSKYSNREYFTK